ncbi:hypothetical protein LV779_26265 [Streptomyces thinghirensis]|nr:hypothetical protein [Streptomyces thinghirensis]
MEGWPRRDPRRRGRTSHEEALEGENASTTTSRLPRTPMRTTTPVRRRRGRLRVRRRGRGR